MQYKGKMEIQKGKNKAEQLAMQLGKDIMLEIRHCAWQKCSVNKGNAEWQKYINKQGRIQHGKTEHNEKKNAAPQK
jgi:hypothetical protein